MSLFENMITHNLNEPNEPEDPEEHVASEGNVSDALIGMLHEQMAHELYNAQLYLKIATNLRNQGLDNLAKLFDGQVVEEHGHQALIAAYLTDRNEDVELVAIEAVNENPKDILEIASKFVSQEQLTTKKLKAIAKAAWDEWDLITFQFVQDLINKQRIEEAEALSFQDQAELTGGNKPTVLLWNMNFVG